ncbi:MAG TPA: DEAD/DEAH box helicase [Kofleriaceae bacterium]|nr:DEAD/DEAH box helicase [Kofleriaceae bacterium]
MSFAERAKHAFSPRIVERGEGYFLDRKIYVSQLDGDRITAHVHGSSIYDVEAFVHQERRRLVLSCSCPYTERSFCKHQWTLVREMDRIAPYLEPTAPGPLVVTMGEPALEVRWRERRRSTPDGWRALISRTERPAVTAAERLPDRPTYAIDLVESQRRNAVAVAAYARRGGGGPPELLWLSAGAAAHLPADERALVELLLQASSSAIGGSDGASMAVIEHRLFEVVLPALCATGRFGLLEADQLRPLVWDDESPRRFRVRIDAEDDRGLVIRGVLIGPADVVELESCPLVLPAGLAVVGDRLVRVEVADGGSAWLTGLRAAGAQRVPADEHRELAEALCKGPDPRGLIEALPWPVRNTPPAPRAAIGSDREPGRLALDLCFDYDAASVAAGAPGWAVVAPDGDLVARDLDAEHRLLAHARELGLGSEGGLDVARARAVANRLLDAGWSVRVERRPVRRGSRLALSVGSATGTGTSWFDLSGAARFGDRDLPLPALLAAVRRGDAFVDLGDGETGLLPEDWTEQLALLARARGEQDELRFEASELALLAALLADVPDVDVDARYSHARDRIAAAEAPRPLDPPDTFVGVLRDYQREGVGWLQSLTEIGMGGCLADDMGLGKTVQMLALLERRRRDPDRAHKPSLAVVPRSLVFNWIDEAARFTPELRVVDYSGPQRAGLLDRTGETDLFLTTYGTVRRDIELLESIHFDLAILDEAQAIKNPATKTARACRRLAADQRFALTGTPVENRLADLASIFQYLNPGLIGRGGTIDRLLDADLDRAGVRVVARVLRPFILRRTKEQVARELPDKAEQLLVCDLEPEQRALYDELHDYYRHNLARKTNGRNRMMVLEALLRLRQAACHPGLLDRSRAHESSAKLDALTEKLLEVIAAGHNALVFSQFTSFLSIVKARLDELGVVYEYLDGRTRDRAARVNRFQSDPACPVFLISLKAGGHGLNLTAADYVFLLDPWWNPAVESQAIDRAHRIGQTRHVFAYRLIARDTVESKVLALQDRKRSLADGIVGAENRELTGLHLDELRDLLT